MAHSLASLVARAINLDWPPHALREELERQDTLALVAGGPLPEVGGSSAELCGSSAEPRGLLLVRMAPQEMDVIILCVAPEFQRQGCASVLLQELSRRADHLASRVFLELRVSNEAAQRLYARHGFIEIGRRKRYYSDNGEDARMMRREPTSDGNRSVTF